MAERFANSVKVTTVTIGAGTLTLGVAMPGFRGVEGLVDGSIVPYHIQNGAAWENGRGRYDADAGTLTRETVFESSNGGDPILLVGTSVVIPGTPLARDLASSGALPVLPDVDSMVIFGDSNSTTPAFYNALARELTGPLCPMADWDIYNVGQTGIATADIVAKALDPATDRDPPLVDAPNTQNYNLWLAAKCGWALYIVPVNDFASPAYRADPFYGPALEKNLRTAVDLLLSMSPTLKIILKTAPPYGADNWADHVRWAEDSPDGTAETNAALYSLRLLEAVLAYKNYDPRVFVFDDSDVYNPGASVNHALHRCDDPTKNCLDPTSNPTIFTASIGVDGVLTATDVPTGAVQVNGLLNFPGVTPGARITGQLTGLGGRPGTYSTTGQGAVASTTMGITTELILNSLHLHDLGWRAALVKFARDFGLYGRRKRRTIKDSTHYQAHLLNIHWSGKLFVSGKSKSGANMLITASLSPEAVANRVVSLMGEFGAGFLNPYSLLDQGEAVAAVGDYATYRELVNCPRGPVYVMFPDGTRTVYTATAARHSQTFINADGGAFATFFLDGCDFSAEANGQEMLVSVDNENSVPFAELKSITLSHNGTNGIGINSYPRPWSPAKATFHRTGNTGGAITVDLRLHNLTDGRFVEGAVSYGTSAGMLIGTFTIGNNIRAATSIALNTANIDAAVAAGIWPAGSTYPQMKVNYYLDIAPSVATDPGTVLLSQI